MKKIITIIMLVLCVFLVGCSTVPLNLKRTADQAIRILNSELSNVNEFAQINKPTIVQSLEVSETDWCLVYQITNDIFFATRWQKIDKNWKQVDIQPYVDNCDWVK